MRALLFHAPAYTADGYDDTRPRLVRAACKGSDNNVERRDIPENGLSVSDWYLRNILYIDARSHEREREREREPPCRKSFCKIISFNSLRNEKLFVLLLLYFENVLLTMYERQ